MMAKVDFPVPRIPINTMDAFGSNTRWDWTGGIGVGVVRGVDRALDCNESGRLLGIALAVALRLDAAKQAEIFHEIHRLQIPSLPPMRGRSCP